MSTLEELLGQRETFSLEDLLKPKRRQFTLEELQAKQKELIAGAQKYAVVPSTPKYYKPQEKVKLGDKEFWTSLGEHIKTLPGAQFLTKDFWTKTSRNLVAQSAEMLASETVTPIGKQRRLIEYGMRAYRGLTGERPEITPREEATQYARSGWDFITFIPKTLLGLAKDPVKTVQDNPLDVMMLIGAFGGKKAYDRVKAKRTKTGGWVTMGDMFNPLKTAKAIAPKLKQILHKVPADIEIELPVAGALEVVKTKRGGTMPFFKHHWEGVKANIKQAGDLPDRFVKFKKPGIRIPLRVFEYYPWLKRILYDEWRTGEFTWASEHAALIKELKTWNKKLPRGSNKRVGIYADYMQEGGAEIMKHMGKEMPKLTPLEMKYYNWGQEVYQGFLPRINQIRTLAGAKPIGKIQNYSTWIRNLSELDSLGIDITKAPVSMVEQHLNSIPLSFAKKRARGIVKAGVELDYGLLLENYSRQATRSIHLTPVIARARTLLEPFDVKVTTPRLKGKLAELARKISTPEEFSDLLGERQSLHSKIDEWHGGSNPEYVTYQSRALTKVLKKQGRKKVIEASPQKLAKLLDIEIKKIAQVREGKGFGYHKPKPNYAKELQSVLRLQEMFPMENFGKIRNFWEKAREHTGKISRWEMMKETPRLATWVQEWTDTIAGQKMAIPKGKEGILVRGANAVNRNLAMAILAFNVRSALIQPSAFKLSYVYLGEKYFIDGFMKNLSKKQRAFHLADSEVLRFRKKNFDATAKTMQEIGKRIGQSKLARTYAMSKKGASQAGMWGLQLLDFETAMATRIGAYEMAVKKYGYKRGGKRAKVFADDVVVKTQASAQVGDISPLQRTPQGKLLTLFQTFIINEWDMLTHDVFGYKRPYDLSKMRNRSADISRFVLGTAVVNAVYEGIFKVRSPYGAPEWAFYRGVRDGEVPSKVIGEMARETFEGIPVVGAPIRWSTSYRYAFPAFIQTAFVDPGYMLSRLMEKPTLTLDQLEWVAKITGVPGTSQARKIHRRIKRGQTLMEAIIGVRAEEGKKKKEIQW